MLNVIIEDTACLLVIGTVSCIFACCFFVLMRISKSGWRSHRFKMAEIILLASGLTGLVCMVYALLVEPCNLQVSTVSIPTSKLPPGTAIRLVEISDLHCDGIARTEGRLPEVIANLHPDVILFAGDAANNRIGLESFRACISKIAKSAPVFAVYGNNDAHRGRSWKIYDDVNVTLLQCDSRVIKVRGVPLWIGGVGVDNERLLPQTLHAAPKDIFSVFVYHYPVGVQPASAANIDLVCAGHTHGGQVCLPLYGPVVTQSALGREFASGLHKVRNTWLYVNRGIGMTGLPARFLCPPEVTVIELTSQLPNK